MLEQVEFLCAGRTFGFYHLENFRDHHAGLADDHGVADADVFAADFVLVVQRGAGNRRALHENGLKFGHGREHAGAPDLHGDGFEHRFGGRDPGNGFVDDGVAGRAAAAGNARPVGQGVDLEHDAVNLVGQLPAQVAVLVVMRHHLVRVNFQDFLDAVADPPEFLRGQAELREGFEHFGMGFEFEAFHLAGGVKHGADGALRYQFRVELLECAGGGVAGVGKRFFPGGGQPGVEASNSLIAM